MEHMVKQTPRDPVLAIRIPEQLKAAIANAARANDRTPSQEVRRVLVREFGSVASSSAPVQEAAR